MKSIFRIAAVLSVLMVLTLLIPPPAQATGFVYCWISCPEGDVQLWLDTEDQCCGKIHLCPADGTIGSPFEVGGYNYEGGYEVTPQTCVR